MIAKTGELKKKRNSTPVLQAEENTLVAQFYTEKEKQEKRLDQLKVAEQNVKACSRMLRPVAEC